MSCRFGTRPRRSCRMEDERRLLVLYGSQTGCAQDVAERVGRAARRRLFRVQVLPMDLYERSRLIFERAVVLVCSTTGQGDEPDNMKHFWRFLLRKDLPPDSMAACRVAVCALGDSAYPKYNYVGKKLFRRLLQLGATPLAPLALADDQHDLGADATVDPWLAGLLPALLALSPLPPGATSLPDSELLPPRYRVTFIPSTDSSLSDVPAAASPTTPAAPPSRSHPHYARLLANTRLTPTSHFQDVRLLTFDLQGSGVSYVPGDVLMLQPQNVPAAAASFLALLGLRPETAFLLEQHDPDVPLPPCLPRPCTVGHLVTHYLDFQSVPRRSFFEVLSHFASSELEGDKLTEFSTAEGQEELYAYCNRPRRSIMEVLTDFHSTTASIPFPYLFDLIPMLQPRAFSIASSILAYPNEVQILVAVVEYKTILHTPRKGVCTSWLASLNPHYGSVRVPVWIVPGTLSFPRQPDSVTLMVGPGTGCAPFRARVQERVGEGRAGEGEEGRAGEGEEGKPREVLFFGCRNREADFFFADEWLPLVECGKLQLFTAFSRDQEEKVYVQHKLVEEAAAVWRCLTHHSGHIFIAGNAKQMPEAVLEALRLVCREQGGLSAEGAGQLLAQLQQQRHLQMETWA